MTTGLFIGRFQPFHLGHLEVIKSALKEVDELIIGIGCSQNTKENPFSVEERIEMIDSVLLSNEMHNYTTFPIPDNPDDDKWVEHIETLLPKFDVVFMSDKNTYGEQWVEKCLKEKYKIKKIKVLEGIDATEIRERMLNNKDWKSLVPKEVADYIEKIKGVERVKGINKY